MKGGESRFHCFEYDEKLNYSSPEGTFSGATLPDAIVDWAGSVGSKIIYNSETSFLSSWPIEQVVWLNNYISPDFYVAVLINHGLISDSWNITPTHWIMWTGKLIDIQSNNPVNKKNQKTHWWI